MIFLVTTNLWSSDFKISKIINKRSDVKKVVYKKRVEKTIVDKVIASTKIAIDAKSEKDFELAKYEGDIETLIHKKTKTVSYNKYLTEKKNEKIEKIVSGKKKTEIEKIVTKKKKTPKKKTISKFKLISKKTVFKDYRYYKFTLPSWRNGRYLYMIFHKSVIGRNYCRMLMYCHGMHARDYHRTVGIEMKKGANVQTKRELVFVGLVDIPSGRGTWRNRWEEFIKKMGKGPELIFDIVDDLEPTIKSIIPSIDKIDIILSGHSGGHRVLDNVSQMMLKGSKDKRLAEFKEKLIGVYHFDVWYSAVVVKYIPKFLKRFPHIKLFASLNHNEPVRYGKKIMKLLQMKKHGNYYSTHDGNLKIRYGVSHWGAFRDMFVWAMENCK
jgi:hypothetical protein